MIKNIDKQKTKLENLNNKIQQDKESTRAKECLIDKFTLKIEKLTKIKSGLKEKLEALKKPKKEEKPIKIEDLRTEFKQTQKDYETLVVDNKIEKEEKNLELEKIKNQFSELEKVNYF